eukprot:TRINITY_DN97_c0_g1_i1.p1 TRINITY_DN97_c0_g1~~TRINITY_DN97_c0_g1_i1.p1  ORF type:complete len:343 (+),score=116.77 TRINITY_DN97_c0_g1_i1:113-1141(+)
MSTDAEKLSKICTMTYKEQSIWFMNGFWKMLDSEEKKDLVWQYRNKMAELDLEKKGEGCKLDELNAHRFLEKFDKTLTVRALRTKLKDVGVEFTGIAKYVPLTYFFIVHYDVDWHKLVNAPQGDSAEVKKAQQMLDEVQRALQEAQEKADHAKAREAEAVAREEEARQREVESVEREKESEAAQRELEAALAELKAQEEAFAARTAELKKKTEEGGIVSRNRAKNELAQHLETDPLPLRRAKINQEAAVRKAEKATQAATEAREAAEKALQAATAARAEAVQAREAADAAVEECFSRVAEAEAYLEEVKSKPSGGEGALWWISRELEEKKKYMPQRRGGVAK